MVGIADGINLRDFWDELSQTRSNEPFLIFEDPDTGLVERFSYAEFWTNAKRAANMFWSRGTRPRDRVGIHLCNSVEFFECLFGLASIGAIVVPINSSYTAAEIGYVLDVCQIHVVVTEPDLLATQQAASCPETDIILVGQVDGFCSYHDLRDAQPAVLQVAPPIEATDPVEIMFTSGTTACPKGVILTHYNLIFSGWYVNWELAMTPTDRYLTAMAATHANLQLSALMPVLTVGAALICVKRYSASRYWRQVRRHRATLMQGMAMMIRTLLRQPVSPEEGDHQLRAVHYFLPITDQEKQEFEARFAVNLLNNYGSTETLVGCITDLAYGTRRWPSVGRVGLGFAARIVDANSQEVPTGAVGEIVVHGDPGRTLMVGYWGDEEATKQVLDSDGWFHTCDYGYVDEQGWFYFLDRKVDLIKRAGENVSTVEVEHILRQFPGVREAAVVGIPDSIRDEAVKAFIVPDAGTEIDIDALLAHCQTQLAYFKIPTIVEIRTDLPHGNYGKVQKELLIKSRKDRS